MRLVVVIGIVLFLSGGTPAVADCGSIPYEEDADIFEPNQNALICWDGTEEILVLSTNLRASKPTKVLEVTVYRLGSSSK